MPPLLQRLSERKPEKLDYLGVSYGLTPQLLRFWKRAGYVPLYLRQTSNELTGEHTCVMIRGLSNTEEPDLEWLREFAKGEQQLSMDSTYIWINICTINRFQKTLSFIAVIQVQGVRVRNRTELT
jgi:tRNA(Met) C34 N-acetyltransferase TmcA